MLPSHFRSYNIHMFKKKKIFYVVDHIKHNQVFIFLTIVILWSNVIINRDKRWEYQKDVYIYEIKKNWLLYPISKAKSFPFVERHVRFWFALMKIKSSDISLHSIPLIAKPKRCRLI